MMYLEEVGLESLEVIEVSFRDRIMLGSTSKGNQLKWFKNGKFIKLDLLGYEGVAEVAVSYLLQWSNLRKGKEWVEYKQCRILEDGKYLGVGCYSTDYRGGLLDVSASKMMQKCGISFGIEYLDFIDFVSDYTHLNCKEYIDKILCLDSITRNDDRHFSNINFLYDVNTNLYHFAPIYDNGSSCMSDLLSYPVDTDFDVNYNSIHAKPFDIDFLYQIHNPIRILINYSGFINNIKVKSFNEKRAVQTIIRGFQDTKGISWEEVY